MPSRIVEPVLGARALFVFHLALLSWWTFVQVYYRVAPRFVSAAVFPMAVVSFALIVIALVVTAQFARGRRGTASETAAQVAVALAVVDLIGETLQFAPRLGFPALLPNDKSTTELVVRGIWASGEFAMRCAMFVALWRAQAGVDKRIVLLFFTLIGVNYLASAISFLRGLGPFTAYWNAAPLGNLAAKIALPISPLWLAFIVYLSRRAASGLHPESPRERQSFAV